MSMTATSGVREGGGIQRRLLTAVITTDGHSCSWTDLSEISSLATRSSEYCREGWEN